MKRRTSTNSRGSRKRKGRASVERPGVEGGRVRAPAAPRERERVQGRGSEIPLHETETGRRASARPLEVEESRARLRSRSLELSRTIMQARTKFTSALFDLAPIGYAVLDSDGIIKAANHEFCSLVGQSRSYAVGLPMLLAVVSDDRRLFLDHLRKCRSSDGEEQRMDVRFTRGSGNFHAHVITRPLKRGESCLCAVIDMEERQRFEDALRSREAALQEAAVELERRRREAEQMSDRLRTLASQISRAEHRERERIAGWMHDDLQQVLVSAKIQVQLALRRASSGRNREMLEAERLLDQALAASRSLALRLSPPVLRDGGLEPALRWLAEWVEEKNSVAVKLDYRSSPGPILLDHERSFVFDAAREMLLNAVKHAKVTEAVVTVRRDSDVIRVEVSDRGCGFDPTLLEQEGAGNHFGLFSLRERVRQFGGDLGIDSAPGQGARITLVVPFGRTQERLADAVAQT